MSGIIFPEETSQRKERTENFISEEISALEKIKSLLSEGKNSVFYKGINLEEQIKDLLSEREYLYLHFPDGYCYNGGQSFLKRVRAEIDYFLKLLG